MHYKGRESRLDLGARNDTKWLHLRHHPRKSNNSSVEIFKPPVRNEEIPPNFDFILPKFHFILPNFYFVPPWRIFVCSVELPDFLRRDRNQSRPRSSYGVTLSRYIARKDRVNAPAPRLDRQLRAYLDKFLYLCEHILYESSNEETV